MILISHRGNLSGPNPLRENTANYIDEAIKKGFDVEIDIWENEGDFFLGHDEPQHKIGMDWLLKRKNKLWVHCKNASAIVKLIRTDLHIFWHEEDKLTITSKKFIWVYPGCQPVANSIAVLPEIHNDIVDVASGVCSDYIYNYKHERI